MIKSLKNLLRRNAVPTEVPQVRVLFVCTGNICRSPTAEAVFRAKVQAAGLGGRIAVGSAGTHAHRGSEPDARAQRFAQARGYDLSAIRGRQLVAEDLTVYDRVLLMDDDNLRVLQKIAPPPAPATVELLMVHATHHTGQRDVPDPYYGAPQGFEQVLDMVEDACDGLLRTVAASLPPPKPMGE